MRVCLQEVVVIYWTYLRRVVRRPWQIGRSRRKIGTAQRWC